MMPDFITEGAIERTEPRPHPVIDAIIAAGRAATARRNAHLAETRRIAAAAVAREGDA